MARPSGFQGLVNACGNEKNGDLDSWLWQSDGLVRWRGREDEEVEEKRGSACRRPSSSRSFVCSRCGGKIRWGWRLDLLASPSVGPPLSTIISWRLTAVNSKLFAGHSGILSVGLPLPLPRPSFLPSSSRILHHPPDRRPRKTDQTPTRPRSMNRIPIETAMGPSPEPNDSPRGHVSKQRGVGPLPTICAASRASTSPAKQRQPIDCGV